MPAQLLDVWVAGSYPHQDLCALFHDNTGLDKG